MFTLLIYLCIFGWLGLRGHEGSSLVAVSGLLVSLAGWVCVAVRALLWLQ